MILSSKVVEQAIDGARTARFRKDIVLARSRDADGKRRSTPLAMVRKRPAQRQETRGSILLIHGFGQNRYAWHLPSRSFGNYLAAAGFDVFNLDLRGHGRSRHLGASPPADLTEYVREDVPAAVNEVQRLSGHSRTFLLGHSLGGLISYAAAPGLGDQVAGVATLGSPYHFTRGSRFLSTVGDTMLALRPKDGFRRFSRAPQECRRDDATRARVRRKSAVPTAYPRLRTQIDRAKDPWAAHVVGDGPRLAHRHPPHVPVSRRGTRERSSSGRVVRFR